MAKSLDLNIFHGRLGREPKLDELDNGSSVVALSVAVNNSVRQADNTYRYETEWRKVKVWGRLAEICFERMHTGDLVLIVARKNYKEYTNNEGKLVQAVEYTAQDAQLLAPRPGRSSDETVAPIEPLEYEDDEENQTDDWERDDLFT